MRLLSSMLYCLLALFGCDDKSSTTTVTRTQVNGEDTLFSRTTHDQGAATFQCVRSSSGRCHYQVFQERCGTAAATETGTKTEAAQCARTPIDGFSLPVGSQRLVKGLSGQVRDCVQAEMPGPGTRCG